MPYQAPSLEDFQRLEEKMDRILALLEKLSAPVPVDPNDAIERQELLAKLNVSKCTLLKLEKEGFFTAIRRGRKTYYPRLQLLDYLKTKNYKPEAIQRITAPTPRKKP